MEEQTVGSVSVAPEPVTTVSHSDGLGQTNLTNRPSAYDVSPSWSPYGTQVFFRSDRDGERAAYKSYVMNADGSEVRSVE